MAVSADSHMQAESARRAAGCVTGLLRRQPFFGSLALRLPLRADPGRGTLASDGREIRYSPHWIADNDAHVIETAIARVVLACALKHHTRRGGRDPKRWQRASQLVTHALLRDAGFALPPDAEAWDGMSVEDAFERLQEQREDDPGDGGASPGGGDDDASAGAGDDDDGGQQPADDDGDDGKSDDPPDPTGDDDAGGQDGSADGAGSGAPSHDPFGTGEVMDAPSGAGMGAGGGDGADGGSAASPADASDTAAEEQAWDEAMHQALNLAQAEGKLPGGIEQTVRGAHAGSLDWRTLLRRHMSDAAKSDYSWSLPNRRFIDAGLYLPSIRSEGLGTVAVIIDTSGSLPAETLAEFWAEVRAITAELQPERVIVLQVDAAVQDAAEHSAADLPDEIAVKGRGGTDFRPGFEWLDEQGERPGVCLYLTDMLCSSYPEAAPPFAVLWVNYGRPPEDWNREPWGERIDIAV